MMMMFIPILIGAIGKVPNGFERGLEVLKIRVRIETIQTTVLIRSSRILETCGDLLSLRPRRKTNM